VHLYGNYCHRCILRAGIRGHVSLELADASYILKMISYCEAFGLFILAKLLFGGLRGKWGGRCGSCCHGGRGHWKGRWENKWSEMTPEEREKIKKGFGGKCGYYGKEKEEQAE
jgi:hypothetical protein